MRGKKGVVFPPVVRCSDELDAADSIRGRFEGPWPSEPSRLGVSEGVYGRLAAGVVVVRAPGVSLSLFVISKAVIEGLNVDVQPFYPYTVNRQLVKR